MDFKNILWHLKTYPLIIILIFGFLGNVFIFYIFLRPRFRSSSLTKYVRLLAIADTTVLFSGAIPNIYQGFNDVSLEGKFNCGCIFQRFILFFTGDMSIWVLTVMTIDRLVAVVFPIQNSMWKSSKNTVMVLVIIVSLSFFKNMPIFFTFHSNRTLKCQEKNEYQYYENRIRPMLSLVFYYLIPAIIMTTCTILIIRKMRSVTKNLKKLNNQNKRISVLDMDSSNHHYSKSLTKMSVAVYVLYMVLITPSMTIWTVTPYLKSDGFKSRSKLYFDITNILVYCHHSLNFYLFYLTGPRFRQEVMIVLGKKNILANDSKDTSNKTGQSETNKNVKKNKKIANKAI